jgi:CspA family cold shock protein
MSNITPVINEVKTKSHGTIIGQCKWFNDKLGYGFVTIQEGDDKGKDIFVHHTGIKPTNSNYKTLKCGEYVHFDIVGGDNGPQGVNITGILGGTLLCDTIPTTRYSPDTQKQPGQFKNGQGQKQFDM